MVADRLAPRVTSVVAGALWEWPPAVCGYHQDQVSLSRSKAWSATSYRDLHRFGRRPDHRRLPAAGDVLFQASDRRTIRAQSQKMAELTGTVRQFRHDAALIAANGINPALGLRDAYTHLRRWSTPTCTCGWLEGEVRRAGCRVIVRKLDGLLREAGRTAGPRVPRRARSSTAPASGAGELAGDRGVSASRGADPRSQ